MARVLVIDDEPDVVQLVAAMLQAGGHEARAGRPGGGTLEDIRAGGYDLVITDMQMPGLTGCQVAEWVGREQPGTPVIGYSGGALDLPDAAVGCFAATLAKPFRRAQLLQLVDRLLPAAPSS